MVSYNNSFREEHYDDPETQGRRLSEFTLIEPERPYAGMTPIQALDKIIEEEESVIKDVIHGTLIQCRSEIQKLGGNEDYLFKVRETPFKRITYREALALLGRNYNFGDDFGVIVNQVKNPDIITWFTICDQLV